MRSKLLQKFVNITIFIGLCSSHICTDNWELVYKDNEPVCWALLKATDFKANFTINSNICNSVDGGEVAVVTSQAQKAVLSDLANRVQEPTLTCYKSTQESVEGKFKSVDYEEPPEFLRILNEKGIVKLSRGIQMGDQITISFSMKVAVPEKDDGGNGRIRVLPAIFRIANSTNFAIQMECKTQDINPECVIFYQGSSLPKKILFVTTEKMKPQLTVWSFGTATFDFLDHKIEVWERFKAENSILTPPVNLSYLGMDEIHVENVIVASVEHTKKCPGEEGGHGFKMKKLDKDPEPLLNFKEDTIRAPRRSLGSQFNFSIPREHWDYYEEDFDLVFDIRVSQAFKGQKAVSFKNITIDFWSRNSSESIFKTVLDENKFVLEHLGMGKPYHINSGVNSGKVQNHRLVDFRFRVSSSNNPTKMKITVSLGSTSVGTASSEHILPLRNFDEIRLSSDTAIFYDVRVKSLRSVEISTCNFRNLGTERSSESVPYNSKCFKNRNILCQKKSEDLTEEPKIPDEPEEKLVWEEDVEIKGIGMNTTEEEEEEIVEDIEKKGKLVKEEEEEEEEIEIVNIQGFQWSIIALTSLTATSLAAIFILNLLRCWL